MKEANSRRISPDVAHQHQLQAIMPLVITKAGSVQYVEAEILAETLGHVDFDGEDWAVGDRLIFEDGTESRIKQEPGEQFHTWDEPTPSTFEDVKQAVGVATARGWQDLFAAFGPPHRPTRDRLLVAGYVLLIIAVSGAIGVLAAAGIKSSSRPCRRLCLDSLACSDDRRRSAEGGRMTYPIYDACVEAEFTTGEWVSVSIEDARIGLPRAVAAL